MRRRLTRWKVALVFMVGGSQLLCLGASAGLGEKETFDTTDAQTETVAAGVGLHVHAGYSVKVIVSNSTKVKEYLSGDGTVFGLTWKGRNHPDFSALLGTYFSEYQELNTQHATGVRRIRGGRRSLKGAHLVIEKSGHMGAIRGRAYIASLFPTGVTANDIK